MKILLYTSYYYPYISGLSLYPQRLSHYLARKFKVTVLTFPHVKGLRKEEEVNGANIIRMPFYFKVSKGYISFSSFSFFFNQVRKNDTIIITAPNVEALPLALISKVLGKKIIVIYCCQVYLGRDIYSKVIEGIINISVYIELFLASKIVVIPDYANKLFIYKKFREKIHEILPLIEPKKISKKALAEYRLKKGKEVWIGFVGRVSREKGLEHLIEAIGKLKRDTGVTLVIAGPFGKDVAGEEVYFEKIRKLCDNSKISHQFFGMLTDSELGAFYSAIDLLVLPSVNKTEAFGMVQVEAMHAGTPVVVSNMPGVRVPVSLTGMGELVEPGNSFDLASKIQNVLDNPKKYFKKREFISKVFDNQKIIKEYLMLLRARHNF